MRYAFHRLSLSVSSDLSPKIPDRTRLGRETHLFCSIYSDNSILLSSDETLESRQSTSRLPSTAPPPLHFISFANCPTHSVDRHPYIQYLYLIVSLNLAFNPRPATTSHSCRARNGKLRIVNWLLKIEPLYLSNLLVCSHHGYVPHPPGVSAGR